ncbi:leucyl aminopeptidase [Georgenia sp. Z1344]|uniref:leucyl aminopeptidase n=1 Tax=Georgenia sp. Z1344 TaxID=3416706 RepID=UPI003CFB6525
MTTLETSTKSATTITADVVVVGVGTTGHGPALVGSDALGRHHGALTDRLAALGVTGKPDQVVRVAAPESWKAPAVVLTGVGPVEEVDAEALRRAAGAATRSLSGVGHAVLALPARDAADAGAVAEGALLGAFSAGTYRSEPETPVERLTLATVKGKEIDAAADRARIVAGHVNATRDLVNASPGELYPESFADRAKELARKTKVTVDVLDVAALEAGGYGGLVGVGKGSTRGPRLVTVSYAPKRAKKRYALVGKGITFDSGGLSLKPPKSMETMKSDMAGAAAVLHTVLAAAELGLPVAVTGYLPLAENLPSGTAQRPSDVLTQRDGTTVEVTNTDAEGRLVLADALVDAVAAKPDAVLDIATLTGAQVVALGDRTAGIMGTDDARADVVAAADAAGEAAWPMPLPPELLDGLRSPVADLKNSGERAGGMLTAGVFLQQFVGDAPWAHIDIAGPSYNSAKPFGYTPVGGTGYGVRTMLGYLEARAAS